MNAKVAENLVLNFKLPAGTETTAADEPQATGGDNTAIPLPDIREALKKKQIEAELAQIEEEEKENKVLIKRSDKKALTKVRLYSKVMTRVFVGVVSDETL